MYCSSDRATHITWMDWMAVWIDLGSIQSVSPKFWVQLIFDWADMNAVSEKAETLPLHFLSRSSDGLQCYEFNRAPRVLHFQGLGSHWGKEKGSLTASGSYQIIAQWTHSGKGITCGKETVVWRCQKPSEPPWSSETKNPFQLPVYIQQRP